MGMSRNHSATETTTIALAVVVVILAASLGALYFDTSPVLASQSRSISGLQSAVSSLVSNAPTSTITVIQPSTITSVRTQTVTNQSNSTVTDTSTETKTSTRTETVANTTLPWFGLIYMTAAPGCTVSAPGSASYPAPCFGPNSSAYAFDCAVAAGTSQGCTQRVNIAGGSSPIFNVTVWYPYTNYPGEQSSQNCKWTEPLPTPPGPEGPYYAYCITISSTSFFIAEPAPGPT